MPERKSFLLRVEPATYVALERWASDELRSLNAQIEYLLRKALRESGRIRRPDSEAPQESTPSPQP